MYDPDQILAPHITWGEMVTTGHRSLATINAEESEAFLVPLTAVAEMLSTIREHFGRPLVVHSGFRCPALNKVVGSSPSSQHPKGEAADFHVSGVSLEEVYRWIRDESGLPYGQCLLEGHQAGRPTWIHLSLGEPWRPRSKSRQAFSLTV